MSVTEEIPFSQLVQHPKDAMAKLEENPRRRLRLVRRDGDDLILESARRAEADDEALGSVARIIMALMNTDRAVLDRVFPVAFPWMRFLPPREAPEFIAEFIETARACADLDMLTPLSTVTSAWRATAAVHADPALREELITPLEEADYGPVPEPGTR